PGDRAIHDSARRHSHANRIGEGRRGSDAESGGAAGRADHAPAAGAARSIYQPHADRSPEFPVLTMTVTTRAICIVTLSAGLGLVGWSARPRAQAQQPPAAPQTPAAPQQPSDITTTITGGPGVAPRLAVPDFIASGDTETSAVAKTIAQVLYDDLNFEREFTLIPRDTYATIPAAKSFEDVPFDRWRELNADGVVVGAVQKTGAGIHVEMRLVNIRTRAQAFGKSYDGSAANPRLYA